MRRGRNMVWEHGSQTRDGGQDCTPLSVRWSLFFNLSLSVASWKKGYLLLVRHGTYKTRDDIGSLQRIDNVHVDIEQVEYDGLARKSKGLPRQLEVIRLALLHGRGGSKLVALSHRVIARRVCLFAGGRDELGIQSATRLRRARRRLDRGRGLRLRLGLRLGLGLSRRLRRSLLGRRRGLRVLSSLRRAFVCAGDVEVVAILAAVLLLVAGPAADAPSMAQIAGLRNALQFPRSFLLHWSRVGKRLLEAKTGLGARLQ